MKISITSQLKTMIRDNKGNDWTSVSSYLPDDLAYGTVTANVSGMWNMNNVANGGFYIHSTGSAYSWKTAWLVSDPIKITSCEPDQGGKHQELVARHSFI